ncbi:MAG: N-acetylmuramoyl-L-alanine amidase [Candidatus Latescibacteria bacterium]|jgi:N-acetylmuramoyl-L-alanine amidase|nr:N-acetylmuramoyl-L-alanine amidase [Candidatus Latescibacterota bacterium]MDP7448053.1 N-acetylmuramoyl-L-alanine amidase [Candidatus Latescibacterota bacterium]HJP29148.1 N-acetylmuramoyl-L-alanine amidase [Candidatus Latescibacterota bacterium]
MHIEEHRVVGDGIEHRTSPNHGGPFPSGAPDTLVLHFTAGDHVDWAIDRLCDPTPGQRVSSHLVVSRSSAITQLLPLDTIAWHAGRSTWHGRTEFNGFSLGIEIDNAGRLLPQGESFVSWKGTEYAAADAVRGIHRNESESSWWHRYPQAQLEAIETLCRLLIDRYGIHTILGHEEISPQRKDDPGPAFPLDEMRRRLLPESVAGYDATAGASPA